ncbi:MAG: 50S ribosomal protein L25/general stress protein Ctc [Bacteroidota bacterium]
MNTIEIIGYQRGSFGKRAAKQLRAEANVPGILYGGKAQVHFYTPMALLKALVYTPQAHFVLLNIEGTTYRCILQDIQFHPVSEIISHIDFLQIFDDKKIKMDIPTVLAGSSPGVAKGGKLVNKMKKLPVSAYPKDMPDQIKINVATLDLGQMARIRDIQAEQYTILAPASIPVAVVAMTRALRTAGEEGNKSAKK